VSDRWAKLRPRLIASYFSAYSREHQGSSHFPYGHVQTGNTQNILSQSGLWIKCRRRAGAGAGAGIGIVATIDLLRSPSALRKYSTVQYLLHVSYTAQERGPIEIGNPPNYTTKV
jgi:hypothetical protein